MDEKKGINFLCATLLLRHQVGDVQSAVKAAQQVLADVRKIFAEKVQANRAAKGEGAGQPKAAAKRSAKGSAKGSAKAKAKP